MIHGANMKIPTFFHNLQRVVELFGIFVCWVRCHQLRPAHSHTVIPRLTSDPVNEFFG